MTTFNLIDERFIPTSHGEHSLRDVLLQAHEITELRDQSPLLTLALHRVLLAISHRMYGPSSSDQWRALWTAGRFPLAALDRYFDGWRNRFDLFDQRHPFFQTAGLASAAPSGVNRLAAEISGTNVKFMFSHVADDKPPCLPFPVVARMLIAHQLTTGQGGAGYGSSPLTRGVAVLVRGQNLFETLMLNLVRYDDEHPMPCNRDMPIWERNTIPSGPTPDGYLDYLTWQSRAVLLCPERDGVQFVAYDRGRMFLPSEDAPVTDPMMAYSTGEKVQTVRLVEHRELWQDTATLLQSRPEVLRWATNMMPCGGVGLDVIGQCLKQSSVRMWRHDHLPLPVEYLQDQELVGVLASVLELADKAGKSLWAITGEINKALAGQAELSYWSRLGERFHDFMRCLPSNREMEYPFAEEAMTAFEDTVGKLDSPARVLRAVVQGRDKLAASLKRLRG